ASYPLSRATGHVQEEKPLVTTEISPQINFFDKDIDSTIWLRNRLEIRSEYITSHLFLITVWFFYV
ncbi:hypothetical protein L9F63_023086, partial [Diploptera punctata]